jgi:hypothetical protein
MAWCASGRATPGFLISTACISTPRPVPLEFSCWRAVRHLTSAWSLTVPGLSSARVPARLPCTAALHICPRVFQSTSARKQTRKRARMCACTRSLFWRHTGHIRCFAQTARRPASCADSGRFLAPQDGALAAKDSSIGPRTQAPTPSEPLARLLGAGKTGRSAIGSVCRVTGRKLPGEPKYISYDRRN